MVFGTLATAPPQDLEQSFRREKTIILRTEADANAVTVERQGDILDSK